MKTKGSKIKDFLLFKPAISTRNLTSLALVALFFGVYVASGGKIEVVPKVTSSRSTFGGINGYSNRDRSSSDRPGFVRDERAVNESENNFRSNSYSSRSREDLRREPSDSSVAAQVDKPEEELRNGGSEKRLSGLAAIEERLKRRR